MGPYSVDDGRILGVTSRSNHRPELILLILGRPDTTAIRYPLCPAGVTTVAGYILEHCPATLATKLVHYPTIYHSPLLRCPLSLPILPSPKERQGSSMNTPSTMQTAAGRSCFARVCMVKRFVLRSSSLALFSIVVVISSFLFIVFIAIAWLTVTRDAHLVGEPDFTHAAGVSLCRFLAHRSLSLHPC